MTSCIFNFVSNISHLAIPVRLNNPFAREISEIAMTAAKDFQSYLISASTKWDYDFHAQKGKMFGVIVVEKPDTSLAYLAAVSGKLPNKIHDPNLVPSVFDDSTDDYFINREMTSLTKMCKLIDNTLIEKEVASLKEERRLKSIAIQERLFENYTFSNLSGETKNISEIFFHFNKKSPPSAAGECAAPKLLQYAIENNLKPISIAEFWWGNPHKYQDKQHGLFYPACRDKCRPVLEFMLDDDTLYDAVD